MEKPPKSMSKIFRFLPKAASAVIAFQNLPFSPRRDKIGPSERANHHHNNNNHHHRFSGPLMPNKSFDELGFDGPEPTSPKISCMGQIKHKKSKKIKVKDRSDAARRPERANRSKLKRFFSAKLEKRSEPLVRSSVRDDSSQLPDRAPSLSQAKRFASGRDVLADFNWSAPFTPVDKDLRNYYSDDDEGRGRTSGSGEEYDDEYKEDVIIPFSAPLTVGGGIGGTALRPRKEVNLWKRRTMAPPRPLQLHSMVRAN